VVVLESVRVVLTSMEHFVYVLLMLSMCGYGTGVAVVVMVEVMIAAARDVVVSVEDFE